MEKVSLTNSALKYDHTFRLFQSSRLCFLHFSSVQKRFMWIAGDPISGQTLMSVVLKFYGRSQRSATFNLRWHSRAVIHFHNEWRQSRWKFLQLGGACLCRLDGTPTKGVNPLFTFWARPIILPECSVLLTALESGAAFVGSMWQFWIQSMC